MPFPANAASTDRTAAFLRSCPRIDGCFPSVPAVTLPPDLSAEPTVTISGVKAPLSVGCHCLATSGASVVKSLKPDSTRRRRRKGSHCLLWFGPPQQLDTRASADSATRLYGWSGGKDGLVSNPRFFLGATGPQSPGNTWLGRFPQEPHTVRRRPGIRCRQMFEKPQKPSKHGPFHTATTPAGWFSAPPCLASDCRCGWDATEMPRGETGLLGCSHRAESLGARKPDSHTPPPGNGPEPARRGPAHRSTRPAGGCRRHLKRS